jgi:hypothetical protein
MRQEVAMEGTSVPQNTARAVGVEKLYEQFCTDIRETDNISFRLLGLVPLVSGTALIALVLREKPLPPALVSLLALFAAAITLGLFRWELCNIHKCLWLINYAETIQQRALDAGGMANRFQVQPRSLQHIGKPGAEKLIYMATVVAWLGFPLTTGAVPLTVELTLAGALYPVMAGAIFVATIVSLFANPHAQATRRAAVIQELSDHLEIIQVIQRCAKALDEKRFDLLQTVFTDDAQLVSLIGEQRIESSWAFLTKCSWTSHLVSDPVIELQRDSAHASSRVTVTHIQLREDGSRNIWIVSGSYEDELVREAEGWRIRKRVTNFPCEQGAFLAEGVREF